MIRRKIILNQKYIFLYLAFVPFCIWLWFFPLFGPLLSILAKKQDLNFLSLSVVFTFGQAVGFLVFGLLSRSRIRGRLDGDADLTTPLTYGSLAGCFVFTMISPYVGGRVTYVTMLLLGVFSSYLMIRIGHYFTAIPDTRWRATHFGTGVMLSRVALPLFVKASMALDLTQNLILASLLLFMPLVFVGKLKEYTFTQKPVLKDRIFRFYLLKFAVIMLGFNIFGGLMYFMVYPPVFSIINNMMLPVSFIAYVLVLLPSGYLADLYCRKHLLLASLCFAGVGYIILMPSLNKVAITISLALLAASTALMNNYIWVSLGDIIALTGETNYYLGFGFAATTASMAFSAWGTRFVPEFSSGKLFWPVLSTAMLFVLFPLAHMIPETKFIVPAVSEDSSTINSGFYLDKYNLTPREKEIVLMLLAGMDPHDIQAELHITMNTIKTHLKNIYRKTHTTGQKDLLLLAWKENGTGKYPDSARL